MLTDDQEPTCGHCGKKMRHNCPRIGDEGGFVHGDTGEFYCEGLNKPQNTLIEQALYGGPPQTVKSRQEAMSKGMAEVIESQDEKKDRKAAHNMLQKLVVALELEEVENNKKISELYDIINSIWVELNGGEGFTNYKVWDFPGQEKRVALQAKRLVERCHQLKNEILDKCKLEKSLREEIIELKCDNRKLDKLLELSTKDFHEVVDQRNRLLKNYMKNKNWWESLKVIEEPYPHIPEKEIVKVMPLELGEAWGKFINGQTCLHCQDGGAGIYKWDWERFIGKFKRGEKLEDTVAEWD